MDLKQKSIPETIYEVEDYFMRKLQTDFDLDVSLKIAALINETIHQVRPNTKVIDGYDDLQEGLSEGIYTVEHYGGVVHNLNIPTFFKLELETFVDEIIPLVSILDIKEIDCDDYLDLINLNKYLNESFKYNKEKNRRTIRHTS